MSYEYPATTAEQKAAALLRKKGWSVTAPLCPDCLGRGFVLDGEVWGNGSFGGGSATSKPCPRGCPQPTMFFGVTNSGFSNVVIRNNTIADGTTGRRGE